MLLADFAVRVTRLVSALIVLGIASACSTSEPVPPPVGAQLFGADPVGAAISGTPDEGTTLIAQALMAHLSADEISYLHWMRLDIDGESFLSDPVVRKAVALVPEALRNHTTRTSSALLRTKSPGDNHCTSLKSAVTARLARALARIVAGAGFAAVGCYGVVPTLGTSAPLCVAGVLAVALGLADVEFGPVAAAIDGAINDALGCAEAAECVHDRNAFEAVCSARGATFNGCASCNMLHDASSEEVETPIYTDGASDDGVVSDTTSETDATVADTLAVGDSDASATSVEDALDATLEDATDEPGTDASAEADSSLAELDGGDVSSDGGAGAETYPRWDCPAGPDCCEAIGKKGRWQWTCGADQICATDVTGGPPRDTCYCSYPKSMPTTGSFSGTCYLNGMASAGGTDLETL